MDFLEAQFDRAVAIVQELPKDGSISMEYEEKLRMYGYVDYHRVRAYLQLTSGPGHSLYKQGIFALSLHSIKDKPQTSQQLWGTSEMHVQACSTC